MSESDEVRRHREENMHGEVDDQIVSGGWSITVGELKRALADIPDDYEVMLENAEVDDCDISNININTLIPPALGSPGLLVMGGGQIVNSEYAYHERLDAHQIVGGEKRWGGYKDGKPTEGWHE
jgi:hypothetical protein